MSSGLPLHEAWRGAYRKNRYCRHLSQLELNQRFRDIVNNMLRVTPEAKIGLPPWESYGSQAMEIFTHVLEELVLRYGPYPNGLTGNASHEPFPDLVGKLASKAASVFASNKLLPKDVFIKFGKSEYMKQLFETGRLRVQSASYYSKPDHNGAIRDDELSLPISLAISREDIINVVVNPQDVPSGDIEQRVDAEYKLGTDYWLYCVSSTLEPRLVADFQADACVIIKDKERFQRLLTLQSASKFQNTGHGHGMVTYVDPLRPKTAAVNVAMSKHFRYEYQREYRFVWQPLTPKADLPYVDLELGSLQNFAELVIL